MEETQSGSSKTFSSIFIFWEIGEKFYMKNDLTQCIIRLRCQVKNLDARMKESISRIRKIEEHSLNQMKFISREVSSLSSDQNWANKLLRTIDTIEELERVIADFENVSYVNPNDVEFVSLEGLIEGYESTV